MESLQKLFLVLIVNTKNSFCNKNTLSLLAARIRYSCCFVVTLVTISYNYYLHVISKVLTQDLKRLCSTSYLHFDIYFYWIKFKVNFISNGNIWLLNGIGIYHLTSFEIYISWSLVFWYIVCKVKLSCFVFGLLGTALPFPT